MCCIFHGLKQDPIYLCQVTDESVSKTLFCAAEDGTNGAVISAAGCAVWTRAVWESVWPLSNMEETSGRVSVHCFALSAWLTCGNAWEVEFSQTETKRQSYAFNILPNLSWLVTHCLVACKPSSQASVVPAVLVAVTDWLGVMWLGVSAVMWGFVCCREEVSLLERNKYKFSPLGLPEELPALFHGETHPFVCSTTLISVRPHIPRDSDCSHHDPNLV